MLTTRQPMKICHKLQIVLFVAMAVMLGALMLVAPQLTATHFTPQ
jgi:hypothetical protein